MTEKELEAAASGFLDTAFNLGKPETAVTEHVAASSSSTTLRSRMDRRHSSRSSIRCEASSPGCIWK